MYAVYLILIVVFMSGIFAEPVDALTFVDNFNSPSAINSRIPYIYDHSSISQQFTTGSNTQGYFLHGINLNVKRTHIRLNILVSVHNASSRTTLTNKVIDVPGAKLHDLSGSVHRTGERVFVAPPDVVLDANTKYFVVISSVPPSPDTFQVYLANDSSETAIDGWSIADEYVLSIDSGTTWVSNAFTQYPVKLKITGSRRTNFDPSGIPVISGAVNVGKVLTADVSGISDGDGLVNATFSYQWVRVDGINEADISGAMGSTYTPVRADLGKKLKVEVSFTDDAGSLEGPLVSGATVSVLPDTLVGALELVSNLEQFPQSEYFVQASTVLGPDFTTGSNLGGYIFAGVTVKVTDNSTATPLLSIHRSGSPDLPGNKLYDLTGSVSSTGYQFFTAPSGSMFDANTKYFLRVDRGGGSDSFAVATTSVH